MARRVAAGSQATEATNQTAPHAHVQQMDQSAQAGMLLQRQQSAPFSLASVSLSDDLPEQSIADLLHRPASAPVQTSMAVQAQIASAQPSPQQLTADASSQMQSLPALQQQQRASVRAASAGQDASAQASAQATQMSHAAAQASHLEPATAHQVTTRPQP